MVDFFKNNRKKFFDSMEDSSVAVFFGNKAPLKSGDEKYPFAPDRNFYYLTGIDDEDNILVITKNNNEYKELLYIHRDNGYLAKWVGANMTVKEAFLKSGVETIYYIDNFADDISSIILKNNIKNMYIDLNCRHIASPKTPSQNFYESFVKRYPYINIINAYDIIAEFRVIKEKYEIDLIRKAVDITRMGIESMMKNCKAGMYEYEIEAYFDFILKKNGVKEKAFQTIGASGKNATILHYTKNNTKTQRGDLVLFDVGAQWGYYNGDLTRTFPVDGKFTEIQKKIYNIVLEGQLKVIDAMKPGVKYSRLDEIIKEHYFEKLKEMGFIKYFEDVSKYYYHSIGHFLGADTHDVGTYTGRVLEEGMVITVEPGLYIDELGIGIRIEDDVLITKDGNEVLSKGLVKTVEDIERFMAGESLDEIK